jgi:hypothetical protein
MAIFLPLGDYILEYICTINIKSKRIVINSSYRHSIIVIHYRLVFKTSMSLRTVESETRHFIYVHSLYVCSNRFWLDITAMKPNNRAVPRIQTVEIEKKLSSVQSPKTSFTFADPWICIEMTLTGPCYRCQLQILYFYSPPTEIATRNPTPLIQALPNWKFRTKLQVPTKYTILQVQAIESCQLQNPTEDSKYIFKNPNFRATNLAVTDRSR